MLKNPPAGLIQGHENFFRRQQREIAFYFSTTFRLHFIHFSFCVLIIFLHVLLMTTPLMVRFEYVFLDLFFRQRMPIATSPAIAYIDMAEDSLQAIGRWPWPRHNHAALVHILHEWGAQAIVFDVIFSEPSTAFDDESLAEAFKEAKNVYLPVMLEASQGKKMWIHSLPEMEEKVQGRGHVNIFPDRDGTIRRVTPFLEYGGEIYPSLALRVAYDYLGEKLSTSGKLNIPLDPEGKIFINWAGKWKETFQHFSFLDVIRSYADIRGGRKPTIQPAQIKGKICIIGLTAVGLTDIKANPLEETYPAVGVQANILNSVLTNQFARSMDVPWNRDMLVMIGILASFFFIFSRKVISFVTGLGLGLVWVMVAFLMFTNQGVWINVMNPLLLIFSLFVFSAVFSITIGKKEQERLFALATRDGLTGLYVIRHFRSLLNAAVIEACKKKQPLSVILLDLDFFKKINDTYGHEAGDAALKHVAAILQNSTLIEGEIEETNVTCRYGGEEFIIMLKKCHLIDAAFNYGEKIRRQLEQNPCYFHGTKIPLTISLGVSVLKDGETVPDLMVHRADEALYRAKSEGRNRTCIEKEVQAV